MTAIVDANSITVSDIALAGQSAYVYIAWASSSSGTGFTTTFDAALDYIAIRTTTTPIVSPAASDFTGLWKKYKGEVGSQGDPGIAATNEYYDRVSGTMDGANKTFTVPYAPAGKIKLYYNGKLLEEGADNDFTVSSTTITMNSIAPIEANGEKLIANFFY